MSAADTKKGGKLVVNIPRCVHPFPVEDADATAETAAAREAFDPKFQSFAVIYGAATSTAAAKPQRNDLSQILIDTRKYFVAAQLEVQTFNSARFTAADELLVFRGILAILNVQLCKVTLEDPLMPSEVADFKVDRVTCAQCLGEMAAELFVAHSRLLAADAESLEEARGDARSAVRTVRSKLQLLCATAAAVASTSRPAPAPSCVIS
jgi:hypothetical protein